jgi:hypothetical protein
MHTPVYFISVAVRVDNNNDDISNFKTMENAKEVEN